TWQFYWDPSSPCYNAWTHGSRRPFHSQVEKPRTSYSSCKADCSIRPPAPKTSVHLSREPFPAAWCWRSSRAVDIRQDVANRYKEVRVCDGGRRRRPRRRDKESTDANHHKLDVWPSSL